MQLARAFIGRRLPPGFDRSLQPSAIRPEAICQRLEKGDARPGRERRIADKNFARQRDAGRMTVMSRVAWHEPLRRSISLAILRRSSGSIFTSVSCF